MQFSNTISKDGLLQQIETVSGLGDTVISGNAKELAYWTASINNWLSIVNNWIHEVEGEWNYDDANHTDFPIEVFSLVDHQQDYPISTNGEKDGLAIIKVEAYDVAAADFYTLDLMLQKDMPANFWGAAADANKPTKYMLSGGSIVFDAPIDIAKATSFRITYDRQAHLFVVGDTTAEAGFSKDFHPILIYGPVMDWAGVKKQDIYNFCYSKIFGDGGRWEGYKELIQKHYLNRLKEHKPYIGRKKKSWK